MHQFHSFLRKDQSKMGQPAETIVVECSPTSCVGARFPARFPLYTWQHSQPTATSLSQGCMRVWCVTRHLHFWHKSPRSFTCHCGNTRVNGHRSQHRELTLEKNILPLLLPEIEHTTFRSRDSGALPTELSRPPTLNVTILHQSNGQRCHLCGCCCCCWFFFLCVCVVLLLLLLVFCLFLFCFANSGIY